MASASQKSSERFSKALQYVSDGQYTEALAEFSKAVYLKPDAPEYFKARAEAYLAISDLKSALMNFKKAIMLHPEDKAVQRRVAAVYDLLGHTYLEKRDFAQARVTFSSAIDLDALTPLYWLHRCLAYVGCDDLVAAHEDINRCISLDHDNVDALVVRARIYTLLGDLQAATADITAALNLDPSHPGAIGFKRDQQVRASIYTNKATDALLGGEHDEALDALSKAIDLNPSDLQLRLRRAIVYREAGDYTKAAQDLGKAVETAGGVYPEAQHHYCLTLNDVGVKLISERRYDEAIPYLNKAIRGRPKIAGFYTNRGDAYRCLENLDLAKADYHTALELEADNTDVKTKLGLIHAEEGRLLFNKAVYGHAEYEFTKAIECNNRLPSFYAFRGETRRALGNLTGAHEDAIKALQLDPNHKASLSLSAKLNGGRRVAVPAAQRPKPPPPKYPEEQISVRQEFPDSPVTLPPSQRYKGLPAAPHDTRRKRDGERVPIKPEVFIGIRRRVDDNVNRLLDEGPDFKRKTDKTDIRELARYEVR